MTIKLRYGYVLSALVTGSLLLFSFLTSLPDGKLHLVFCSVGQGDATYIRFPDGRDMLVDGGPNDSVIECLGNHMPFWDRRIDVVVMTHPERDHMQGLITVLDRFDVGYLVRSDIVNHTEGHARLMEEVVENQIPTRYMTRGDQLVIGSTTLSFLWPTDEQIARGNPVTATIASGNESITDAVLGATIQGEINEYSLVFALRYGAFDAIFTGDADTAVEAGYLETPLADRDIEVLKVPHHGSRTGMTDSFLSWLTPELAIVSVGKNGYGHPTQETLNQLSAVNARVARTDKEGDIEIVTDGTKWWSK